MKIEVLISTMNLKNEEKLINSMKIKGDYIIINQTSKIEKIESLKVYNYNEKGLSRSRNRAITNSKSEICILADDDVIYEDNYLDIIENAYKKYPKADIITFGAKSLNPNRIIKKVKSKKINKINSMRIISSQITFKRDSLIKNNIKFDEKFGAGSKFDKAEETIMLCDALRKGLRIINIPIVIATIKQEESTWFKGFNKDFLTKQGACFYRMNQPIYMILIIQYAIRKYKLYKKNATVKEALICMVKGANEYKKECENEKNRI